MPLVRLEHNGCVATVILNRPERRNALTSDLCDELLDVLHEVECSSARAVVLTGAGKAFCSGSDLTANFTNGAPPPESNLRRSRHPVLLTLRALSKPVICAVNGHAAGIGVGLALAGDLVVAKEDASFILGFSRMGLVPDGGTTWFLERAIGRPRAMELAMLGEPIGACRAAEIGLIGRCFTEADFDQGTRELAERVARGPTAAYALVKRMCDAVATNSIPEQLELEAKLQAEAARTEDFAEALAAFRDKRDPVFVGR